MVEETVFHLQDHHAIKTLLDQQSLMIDTIPIQIWFLTDVDTYGKVNTCHASFLGKQKEEIEFKRLEEFLPKSVSDACRASNQEVFISGKAINSEEWVVDSAGESRLLQISKTPHFDDHGKILSIVCCAMDITDQRRAEKELLRSEGNFRSLIETIEDIVIVSDFEGYIIYVNPAAAARLGYKREELCTLSVMELHPGKNKKEVVQLLSELFSGKRETCPLPMITKNGETVPVETRVWRSSWNGKRCIFGFSKDLSREQEALQKFDRLFRMNPALMAVSKLPERTFVNVNEAFVRTLGFTQEDVIGKSSSELGLIVDQNEHDKAAEILAQGGRIQEVELRIRSKHGKMIYGLFSGDVIETQGARFFLTVMVDITKRRNAEMKLEKTVAELRKALSEIKTLKGIVPICAQCKKIRDDKGYWQQVEAYVAKHTDAVFSHGICPQCVKDLYPGLDLNINFDLM